MVGSPRDDRVLQVSTWVWAPLFTRSAALNPLPFLPGRRRWLKITKWPRALQRAARAAKGKDNVLAALIGVCGCHILITSLKKGGGGRKNITELIKVT